MSTAKNYFAALKSAETFADWLGRQDSNLGMAESKSDYFTSDIRPHSEKCVKLRSRYINRLPAISEYYSGVSPLAIAS
jgi:hypothetical protein